MPRGGKRRSGDWLEVSVEVAGIDSDVAADIFRQVCPGGVAIEPAVLVDSGDWRYRIDGEGDAVVKGYIPPGSGSLRLRRSLRLALSIAPLQQEPRWRRAKLIPGAGWQEAWKRYFKVRRIGARIVVKPAWESYASLAGEIVIELDPGMAFGTSQHPTTEMCLRALETEVQPGMRVLDIGSGSGILSVAAAKLGAAAVVAVDTDPVAVASSRANAVSNGVDAIVSVRLGTIDGEVDAGPFGLIVANISASAIEKLASDIARGLRQEGLLIASGFLRETLDEVRSAIEESGLRVDRVLEEGDWRSLIARKVAGR